MLEAIKPHLLLTIVVAGMLVGLSWSFGPRWAKPRGWLSKHWERLHRLLMAVCACLGVWTFTFFGDFHDHGVYGHINFHSHDCYHYYFGSKYLKEWGYDGMYFATVAALEEIGRDEPRKAIRFERIRDLRGSAHFLRRDDFLPMVEAAHTHFSPERWASLKRDLSFLREKEGNNSWWQGVMLDSGFNPPPSYAVISSALSNRVPLNDATWKWVLGGFDFALLGIGVGAMAYALGPVPALFTLVILGNTPFRTYNWTGGSFLRQLWVFFLMLGVAALARRRWGWAGAALGACTAAVFFPVFFLFGATVPLGYRWYRTGSRAELIRLVGAAAAVLVGLIALSLLRFGVTPWLEWRERIGVHSVTFFDNHLGIKKIVTFAPEVARQAFGASDFVYPEWNRALVARLHRMPISDMLLTAVISIWTVAGALRARPAEACVVVGSGLLVFWTMPASYYTIYVGVFAAVMLSNRNSPWARARFLVVCVALVASIVMLRYEHDLITESFLLSCGWVAAILIISSLYWIERPAIAQEPRRRERTVGAATLVAAALLLVGTMVRNHHYDAAFLPKQVLRGGHVADVFDVGPGEKEAAHRLVIGETLRQPRSLMDTFGYLVQDECGILRNGKTIAYDLAPAPHGGRLVVRTDSFYRGELTTKVNGQPLPNAHLEPQQTLFQYLQIPLPSDLGDGPLHVEQETTAQDVGVFTVWLVED
ncbi:MAG TPA: glycosyltransferase family 87 protein [Polyangiaceae bacterium]|nr:glycosyltransferase family 87 protein [Polyangiaceae bacterium]